jgi:hypothetical protein
MSDDKLPLKNQVIVRPMLQSIHAILEMERSRINDIFAQYPKPGGYVETLGQIYEGYRPDKKLGSWPNICLVPTGRSVQWNAHRETRESCSFRIWCNVRSDQEQEVQENVMNDFTDTVVAVLQANPQFSFNGLTGDPPVECEFMVATVTINNIGYGTLDEGNIRSGQIDITYDILMQWPNVRLWPLDYESQG